MSLNLGEVTLFLEQYNKETRVPLGFGKSRPNTIKAGNAEVCFECAEDTTVGEMLTSIKHTLSKPYQNKFCKTCYLDEYSPVYLLSVDGLLYESVGYVMLNYMVGNYNYI